VHAVSAEAGLPQALADVRAAVAAATDAGEALRAGTAAHHLLRAPTPIRRVADMSAWWHWTGTIWRRDHDSAHVREHARTMSRALPETDSKTTAFKRNPLCSTGISGCERVAESDPRISVRAADLDAHPLLLNTSTGVIDLATATSPDPGLLLTRSTTVGVELESGAASHPRWTAFLDETFSGDSALVGYLQRLAGLALLGEVREQCCRSLPTPR
jgi:putative DNA primase/helicase